MSGKAHSRRSILIAGAAGAVAVSPASLLASPMPVRRWRGTALGVDAGILLALEDRGLADRLVRRALDEIRRLEGIFSLFDPHSALSRLNRDGHLVAPPPEMLELMSVSRTLWHESEGAFDPTIQPLWRLFARHADGSPDGRAIAKSLDLVGFEKVTYSEPRVVMERPGMALTFNGIAQGYITDRIADLLREAGLGSVLVQLGEVRALGTLPDGQPWPVGIEDPRAPGTRLRELQLENGAAATSGGYAGVFGASRWNHLLDPRSGNSPPPLTSVTVTAPYATLADGLSTALSLVEGPRVARILQRHPQAGALLADAEGNVRPL